jgi:hypothetical protein
MKKQDKTNILINLLKREEKIEKIIEYIYINIYQLIDEIPNIDNVSYFQLEKFYINYFKKNIEEKQFFESLFIPYTRLRLSKLYTGIVCKLVFFSIQPPMPLFLYNDQDNWLTPFLIYKKIENNNLFYKKKTANLIITKNLTEANIRDKMNEKSSIYNTKLILYQYNLENNKIIIPNIYIKQYEENLFKINFENYKKNYFNQAEYQLKIIAKEKQEKILNTQEYFYLGYDNVLYNKYFAFLRSFKKN